MPLSSYFLKRPLKMEVGQGCGAGMWTLRFLIRLTICLTHALFNFSQTDLREHTSQGVFVLLGMSANIYLSPMQMGVVC